MYFRYKSRKKDRTLVKILAVLLVLGVAVFCGYRYREYLMFWKYSENRLSAELQQAVSCETSSDRTLGLEELLKSASGNTAENPLDPAAWFFRGRVYREAAWQKMPGTFSEMVIKNLPLTAYADSRDCFISAVKDIKKGMALSGGKISPEMQMMLAESCFFSGFTGKEKADELFAGLNPEDIRQDVSFVRFYSFISILSGRAGEGFAFLDRYGDVTSGTEGRLFLAGIRSAAGLYTDAVMVYRDLLSKEQDVSVKKLIHLRLGKIFAVQSLYPEALQEYAAVLELDPSCEEALLGTAEINAASGHKVRTGIISKKKEAVKASAGQGQKTEGEHSL